MQELSEKDQLVKSIREKAENASNGRLRAEFLKKSEILENNKTVTK